MHAAAIVHNLPKIRAVLEPICVQGRIPGAAIAIVAADEVILAEAYGYRDLEARLTMTVDTLYPIASTTKAMNAVLLGLLVEEGRLDWDVPVQTYLPSFRLADHYVSAHVTLRDLITLRTGLPRHDWAWLENPIARPELVQRLRHLPLSASFRERFQYNNLTVTAAGHVAEVVTGKRWEDLIKERLLDPLTMTATICASPMTHEPMATAPTTCSYHETGQRQLERTWRLTSEVTAPSGGSVHSTVLDMAKWLSFNLRGIRDLDLPPTRRPGAIPLIAPSTLRELYTPQILVGSAPGSPAPDAAYAMGWFVSTYNGRCCLSHGGYQHDVDSDVMLLPSEGIGLVSFTNFGFPTLARTINLHAADALTGNEPVQSLAEKLAEYESKVANNRRRIAAVPSVEGTAPSRPIDEYIGHYANAGYGEVTIEAPAGELVFHRHRLVLPLQHWYYDSWVAKDSGLFFLHAPHAFDGASLFTFETDPEGEISALLIPLEPTVAPIRFERRREAR